MKIRRVILRGVRNFQNLDLCLEDEWSGAIPDNLLLIGPNGSGKTTLLQVISNLWNVLWRFFETVGDPIKLNKTSRFLDCRLTAMEIIGLEEDAPAWVCLGNESKIRELSAEQPESYFIGISPVSVPPTPSGLFSAKFELPASRSDLNKLLWAHLWPDHFIENIIGAKDDLPNLVFLGSETRFLPALEGEFDIEPEPERYEHLVRYQPVEGRKGSIENYLFTLSAIEPGVFKDVASQVNQFWIGKRLAGFDPRTKRLLVEIEATGEHHLVDGLSSGEKQVLLMIAFITRWLRPGGIVLIDEPDLHLHVSWTNALVSHLQRLVSERDGQLVIASHAPALWDMFPKPQRIELGDVAEVRP